MKFLLLLTVSLAVVVMVQTGRVKRVVGGRKTKAHKYPWLVFLETKDQRGEEGRCGGTIIHPRNILTAAHCLMDSCGNIVRKVKVHLGAQDVCEEDWSGTHLVRPSRFIFHPGYNPQTDDNDIAILRLKRDIRFGPKVWMISLPPPEAAADCELETQFGDLVEAAREACEGQQKDGEEYEYYYEEDEEDYYDDQYSEDSEYSENFPPVFQSDFTEPDTWEEEVEYDYEFTDNCTTYYDGQWATIAGWGATYKFDGSCILRHARKKIYPNHHSLCLDQSDYVMERDKICAYNPHWNSDACQGDSGSALVVLTESGPVLVGVVSYGWECGDESAPGVYSRVQYFRQWILQTILSD